MQTITRRGMSLDDYIRRFDEQGRFELLDGEVVPMSPTVFGHDELKHLIFLALYNFATANGEWKILMETPFVEPGTDEANWVKGSFVPDVMAIRKHKFDSYIANTPDYRQKPLPIVPELVVEILSPTDRYSDVIHKIELYFQRGVQMVWLLDGQNRKVSVFTGDVQKTLILGEKDTLKGGEVLPGFARS